MIKNTFGKMVAFAAVATMLSSCSKQPEQPIVQEVPPTVETQPVGDAPCPLTDLPIGDVIGGVKDLLGGSPAEEPEDPPTPIVDTTPKNSEPKKRSIDRFTGFYMFRNGLTGRLDLSRNDLPLSSRLAGRVDFEGFSLPNGEFRVSKHAYRNFGVATELDWDLSGFDTAISAGLLYETTLGGAPKIPYLTDFLAKHGFLPDQDKTFVGVKLYPVSTGNGMQVGLYGNTSFGKGDVVLEGRVDFDIGAQQLIGEMQLGKKLSEKTKGVLQLKVNSLPGGAADFSSFDVGLGLEYKF